MNRRGGLERVITDLCADVILNIIYVYIRTIRTRNFGVFRSEVLTQLEIEENITGDKVPVSLSPSTLPSPNHHNPRGRRPEKLYSGGLGYIFSLLQDEFLFL